jgi:hypothetical protein
MSAPPLPGHSSAERPRDNGRAVENYREALQLAHLLTDWRSVIHCVAGLAAGAANADDALRAGRLWGGVDVLAREIGWTLEADGPSYDRATAACAERYPTEFAAGIERGTTMTPDEIAEYALTVPAACWP